MSTTPGPWHAMSPFGKSLADHGYRIVAKLEGRASANLYIYAEALNMLQEGRGCVWGAAIDDARLIAAAPDLLDELGKAADTFADLARTLTLLDRPILADACRIAEQSARAAIAKAVQS